MSSDSDDLQPDYHAHKSKNKRPLKRVKKAAKSSSLPNEDNDDEDDNNDSKDVISKKSENNALSSSVLLRPSRDLLISAALASTISGQSSNSVDMTKQVKTGKSRQAFDSTTTASHTLASGPATTSLNGQANNNNNNNNHKK